MKKLFGIHTLITICLQRQHTSSSKLGREEADKSDTFYTLHEFTFFQWLCCWQLQLLQKLYSLNSLNANTPLVYGILSCHKKPAWVAPIFFFLFMHLLQFRSAQSFRASLQSQLIFQKTWRNISRIAEWDKSDKFLAKNLGELVGRVLWASLECWWAYLQGRAHLGTRQQQRPFLGWRLGFEGHFLGPRHRNSSSPELLAIWATEHQHLIQDDDLPRGPIFLFKCVKCINVFLDNSCTYLDEIACNSEKAEKQKFDLRPQIFVQEMPQIAKRKV